MSEKNKISMRSFLRHEILGIFVKHRCLYKKRYYVNDESKILLREKAKNL